MKKYNVLKAFVLISATYSQIACQPVNHSFTSESASQSPGAASDAPASGLPPVTNLASEIPTDCANFLMKPPTIDSTATQDKDIISPSGNLIFPQPFRRVYIASDSGSVDVHSAIHATIASETGKVRINAHTIGSANIGSGELCIRANHIEFADSYKSSGIQVVAANTIKEVRLGSAPFHVYRATIQKLVQSPTSRTGYKGQVCLHDGAKILDFGGYSPDVARSDCQ